MTVTTEEVQEAIKALRSRGYVAEWTKKNRSRIWSYPCWAIITLVQYAEQQLSQASPSPSGQGTNAPLEEPEDHVRRRRRRRRRQEVQAEDEDEFQYDGAGRLGQD